MIFVEGDFHPICGHFFWNDKNGANLFCKKLGYESADLNISGVTISTAAVMVGRCKAQDTDIAQCTGGLCNTMEIGGTCSTAKCLPGNNGIKIACHGGLNRPQSCEEDGNNDGTPCENFFFFLIFPQFF